MRACVATGSISRLCTPSTRDRLAVHPKIDAGIARRPIHYSLHWPLKTPLLGSHPGLNKLPGFARADRSPGIQRQAARFLSQCSPRSQHLRPHHKVFHPQRPSSSSSSTPPLAACATTPAHWNGWSPVTLDMSTDLTPALPLSGQSATR